MQRRMQGGADEDGDEGDAVEDYEDSDEAEDDDDGKDEDEDEVGDVSHADVHSSDATADRRVDPARANALFRSGAWSAFRFERWAVAYYNWPVAPYCDFKRYTKCCPIPVDASARIASVPVSRTPVYKKVRPRGSPSLVASSRSIPRKNCEECRVIAGIESDAAAEIVCDAGMHYRRKELKMFAVKRRERCLRVRSLSQEEESDLDSSRAAHALRVAAVQRVSDGFAIHSAPRSDDGLRPGICGSGQVTRSSDSSLGSEARTPASLHCAPG